MDDANEGVPVPSPLPSQLPATVSPPGPPDPPEKASLTALAELATSNTKVIVAWAVALAAFGFFGLGQRYWELGQGRAQLGRKADEISALRSSTQAIKTSVVYSAAGGSGLNPNRISPKQLHRLERSPQDMAAKADEMCRAFDAVALAKSASAAGSTSSEDSDKSADGNSFRSPRQTSYIKSQCAIAAATDKRIDALVESYEKKRVDLSEIVLKTPLFETRVITRLAPLAELVILLLLVIYIDRKRREALKLYVAAVRDAGLLSVEQQKPERIDAFNRTVRDMVKGIPFWLVPFPPTKSGTLPADLRVEEPLGNDARGPLAWAKAACLVAVLSTYTFYLFGAAVSRDIAVIFSDRDAPGLKRATVTTWTTPSYVVAWLLAGAVLLVLIAVVTRWRPVDAKELKQVDCVNRRRLVMAAIPALALTYPLALAFTGQPQLALKWAPKIFRYPLRRLSSTQPRRRRRGAHWQDIGERLLKLDTFREGWFVISKHVERQGFDAGRPPVAHYVFPAGTSAEIPRLYLAFRGLKPLEWRARRPHCLILVGQSPEVASTIRTKFDLATAAISAATASPDDEPPPPPPPPAPMYLQLEPPSEGQTECKATDHARLSVRAASISAELFALSCITGPNPDYDKAFGILEQAISAIHASRLAHGDSVRNTLRLYDLAGGLAYRLDRADLLKRLTSRLAAQRQPAIDATRATYDVKATHVNLSMREQQDQPRHHTKHEKKRARVTHLTSKPNHRERRHVRQSSKAEYLTQAIDSRLARWHDATEDSRWKRKWKSSSLTWKVTFGVRVDDELKPAQWWQLKLESTKKIELRKVLAYGIIKNEWHLLK